MSEEQENKNLVGRWFTGFLGKTYSLPSSMNWQLEPLFWAIAHPLLQNRPLACQAAIITSAETTNADL